MPEYCCKLCNYQTKYKNDYTRHANSKKHKLNVYNEDNLTPLGLFTDPNESPKLTDKNDCVECKYCKKSISRYKNLNKHYKICLEKHQRENKLEEQVRQLEQDKKQLQKQSKRFEQESKYFKNLFNEAGSLVKHSVTALTYAVNNYEDAPAIKKLTYDNMQNHIVTDETKFVEYVLSAFRNKTLNQFLGDIIIKMYKKNDPTEQSIWNTDDTRLTYILKELLGTKTDSNWIVDKKGVKTATYIVDPMLNKLKDLLSDYHKKIDVSHVKKSVKKSQIIFKNDNTLLDIVNGIDNGTIKQDILKYISSRLRLTKSLELDKN